MTVEFEQELLCEPWRVDLLMEFGLRYHRECEEYDQRVCRRKDDRGIAVPCGREYVLVNRNARAVHQRLAHELLVKGIATKGTVDAMMQKAIAMAARPFDIEWDKKEK